MCASRARATEAIERDLRDQYGALTQLNGDILVEPAVASPATSAAESCTEDREKEAQEARHLHMQRRRVALSRLTGEALVTCQQLMGKGLAAREAPFAAVVVCRCRDVGV